MAVKKSKLKSKDVVSRSSGEGWVYSDIVKDHFFHPRNFLPKEPKQNEFSAEGQVGSPQCGDVMKIWIKIDPKTEKIKKLKWRTFGCASAIAATSMFSVMATEKGGMKVNDALKIKPQDIMSRLGGLPVRKVLLSSKYFILSAYETAIFFAKAEAILFAAPGSAFCSCITTGILRRNAAMTGGKAAYPPVENTTSGLLRQRNNTLWTNPLAMLKIDDNLLLKGEAFILISLNFSRSNMSDSIFFPLVRNVMPASLSFSYMARATLTAG